MRLKKTGPLQDSLSCISPNDRSEAPGCGTRHETVMVISIRIFLDNLKILV
jgi:hypothetical protein